ncbi:MAG: hypothetical protein HY952_00365 [Elusimicrobia bacterium]|nr:hypothetical protein [Elusimicrobiota bacterium]
MIKIVMNLVLISGLSAPALAGDAAAQLGAAAPVAAPAPAEVKAQPALSWTDAAKAAFEREVEAGGLTNYANLKELPPGARRQLDNELANLPQGPGNTSEAFKMNVNGRTAFVIQSYVYDDTMRAWLFNAAGVLVARGEGSVDKPFAWLPL